MTLLAGFKVLLARYSGQDDLLVGVPIAGRTRRETESLIGFFVNTLVMRGDLASRPGFEEFLARVRETALGAYAHQDLPFEKLVEELQPERDRSRSPLFQVMFQLQNVPGESLARQSQNVSGPGRPEAGLELEQVGSGNEAALFELFLTLRETRQGVSGALIYDLDLFGHATISRMSGHFENLLAGIVSDPSAPVWELPLLSESEREQLLVEWAGESGEISEEESLHELFELQAMRRPETVAVVYQDQSLSYGELNRRANQLARHLWELGVGPEGRVGVCLERSPEMVIGILGILKAGGAYLPLDPAYPQARLSYMVEDSRPAVVVTRQGLVNRLPERHLPVVCLEVDWEKIGEQSDVNPISRVSGGNVAYVIYTSGSTGRPKGVMGLHRGAINRCRWMWERYPFEEWEVCCQKTSLNFVDAVWEVFGPLLSGIRMVAAPEPVTKDPVKLRRLLDEQGVTRLVLAPSMLNVLLEQYRNQPGRGSVMLWVSSGEKLSLESARRFGEVIPWGRLLNLYGSSEVSADVSWSDVKEWVAEGRGVTIGRAIANTRLYALDRNLQPVAVGVLGELYAGGEGLARGYVESAELTAEKFVPDGTGRGSGERLYRTGDLCGYLANGEIEYVGRVDHQVKIRGYRIELGEIEETLKRQPEVREAIVTVREDEPGETATGGLCRTGGRLAGERGDRKRVGSGVEEQVEGESAGIYGAGGDRRTGEAAADGQREGGSQGAT